MKILLADPNPQVRSALRLLLTQIPGAAVSGETGEVLDLFAQIAQECPDWILFDPDLVGAGGQTLRSRRRLNGIFKALHEVCPHAQIAAISSRFETEADVLAAGADAFLSKTEPPDIFLKKLTQIFS